MAPLPQIHTPAVDRELGRITLLHSNGMCAAFYDPLARELAARGVATTALDLPGFAGSPPPDHPGWDSFLEATEPSVRAALGPDGVLVGHSLGGLTGLLLAPRLPLRALVLMEPAVFPWRWLARLGAALYVRQVFGGSPGFTNRGPWFWRLHDPDAYDPALKELVAKTHALTDREVVAGLHTDLPSRYPLAFDAIRVPVVVVRGASSGPVMAAGQRDLVRRFPDARPATLPEAGHWMVGEQDAALAGIVAAAARGEGPC